MYRIDFLVRRVDDALLVALLASQVSHCDGPAGPAPSFQVFPSQEEHLSHCQHSGSGDEEDAARFLGFDRDLCLEARCFMLCMLGLIAFDRCMSVHSRMLCIYMLGCIDLCVESTNARSFPSMHT